MRCDTTQHPFYCGIDLHARTKDVCILDHQGEIVLHRHLQASPDALLKAMAPYRDDLVSAVECLFTWDWLADLCAQEGLPVVLGHALYRKAIPAGKAKNDQIEAHKMAGLRRGGMLPQAYVEPAEMRPTRDRLRRRLYLTRQRAELLTHVQHTHRQDNRPEIGTKMASKANRNGGAERFPDPAVHKRIAVDLARLGYDAELRRDRECHLLTAAKQDRANALYLLRTVPGIGTILSVVLLYESHAMQRFPRVLEVVAYGRVVKGATESAGKHSGTSGTTSGNASLTWAFAEAAVLCLRNNPAGQTLPTRVAKKHGQGKALTVLAHKLARAVYDRLQRGTACERATFLHAS